MGLLSEQFGTDKTKEIEGIWVFPVGDGPAMPGFKISRQGPSNKRYTKALEKATKPVRQLLRLETLPDEQAQAISRDVFIKGVLIGWKNVSLSDVTGVSTDTGEAAFNQENAEKLFERLPDLYADLDSRSKQMALFRAEEVEADLGN